MTPAFHASASARLLSPCALLLATLLCACTATPPREVPGESTAVVARSAAQPFPELDAAKLTPEYWIARAREPDALLLDADAIAAQNARLLALGPAVSDLAALPESLPAENVRERIRAISASPSRELFDAQGEPVPAGTITALEDALALDLVGDAVAPRWALVVERADLRAFPTTLRVFSNPDDTDIDRWQESALFPGTPVAVLHTSRDGRWSFVAGKFYSAWIETRFLAEGERTQVLGYAAREPFLIVTGAVERTVFTPEAPSLSALPLDMGVRFPLLADWPQDRPVNGQLAAYNHVVELPLRDAQGKLSFAPALVARSADVATSPLPLTRANLLRQAFKFLGERYGWGHGYGTRDCSGFVSEIFRSFGVELPRNTSDQRESRAFRRTGFDANTTREQRRRAIAQTDVGDLIHIPGHVMMVIGHERGETFVIHDTAGTMLLDAQGEAFRVPLNQVSVTPLSPLHSDAQGDYIDRMLAIQRLY